MSRYHRTCFPCLQSSLRFNIWYHRYGILTTRLRQWLHFIRRLTAGCRDYIGVLNLTANIPANHENANGVSADPQVQGLVDQFRDLIRRDLLTPAARSPGAVSTAEPLLGEVRDPLSMGVSPPSGGGVSPETRRLLPASVPAKTRMGIVMRKNRIPRPNIVARRAAAERTVVVTRYRVLGPNNNNNNNSNNSHVTLAERFQPSTLHKLRQLGFFTHTDTPDTTHPLDVKAVAAKVTYTITNTQPSYSGEEESDRVKTT